MAHASDATSLLMPLDNNSDVVCGSYYQLTSANQIYVSEAVYCRLRQSDGYKQRFCDLCAANYGLAKELGIKIGKKIVECCFTDK